MDNQEIYSQPLENNFNQNTAPGWSKKQRAGLYVLIFLVIIILGVWYFMVRRFVTVTMYGSLNPTTLKEEQLNAQKLVENQKRLEDVYNTDTDGDTIPDWEELNIYGTSPYLADSDGDGFNDKQEIDKKTDPNCPEGKECIGSMTVDQIPTDGTTTTTAPNIGQDQLQLLKQAFGDNPDINFLRQQLLKATTTDQQKEVINGLTDQQILDFYRQLLQATPASSGSAPSSTISTTTNQ